MKKSERFDSIEDYQKSATKTALLVAYNRKKNAILKFYGLKKKFENYEFQIYEANLEKKINYFLYESNCPISIMKFIIDMEVELKNDMSVEGIIYHNFFKTTEESFVRFGDKNHITKKIRRNYFEKDALGIDVIVSGLEYDFNNEITENDIVDFITKYPSKMDYYLPNAVIEAEEKFKILVGFIPNSKFIREFLQEIDKVESEEIIDCPF